MKYLLLPLLMISLSAMANSEAVEFEVFLYGKKIGNMTVSKHIKGDTVNYQLKSYSKAKLLWMEYEDISHCEIKYIGKKLVYCDYKEDMNGKTKYLTKVKFDGKQYIATTKAGTRIIQVEPLPSLLSLYFNEPVHTPKIFFETQLFSTGVQQKHPGHYVFKTSEGHDNEYIYTNGEIDELIFHTALATVKMKRKK